MKGGGTGKGGYSESDYNSTSQMGQGYGPGPGTQQQYNSYDNGSSNNNQNNWQYQQYHGQQSYGPGSATASSGSKNNNSQNQNQNNQNRNQQYYGNQQQSSTNQFNEPPGVPMLYIQNFPTSLGRINLAKLLRSLYLCRVEKTQNLQGNEVQTAMTMSSTMTSSSSSSTVTQAQTQTQTENEQASLLSGSGLKKNIICTSNEDIGDCGPAVGRVMKLVIQMKTKDAFIMRCKCEKCAPFWVSVSKFKNVCKKATQTLIWQQNSNSKKGQSESSESSDKEKVINSELQRELKDCEQELISYFQLDKVPLIEYSDKKDKNKNSKSDKSLSENESLTFGSSELEKLKKLDKRRWFDKSNESDLDQSKQKGPTALKQQLNSKNRTRSLDSIPYLNSKTEHELMLDAIPPWKRLKWVWDDEEMNSNRFAGQLKKLSLNSRSGKLSVTSRNSNKERGSGAPGTSETDEGIGGGPGGGFQSNTNLLDDIDFDDDDDEDEEDDDIETQFTPRAVKKGITSVVAKEQKKELAADSSGQNANKKKREKDQEQISSQLTSGSPTKTSKGIIKGASGSMSQATTVAVTSTSDYNRNSSNLISMTGSSLAQLNSEIINIPSNYQAADSTIALLKSLSNQMVIFSPTKESQSQSDSNDKDQQSQTQQVIKGIVPLSQRTFPDILQSIHPFHNALPYSLQLIREGCWRPPRRARKDADVSLAQVLQECLIMNEEPQPQMPDWKEWFLSSLRPINDLLERKTPIPPVPSGTYFDESLMKWYMQTFEKGGRTPLLSKRVLFMFPNALAYCKTFEWLTTGAGTGKKRQFNHLVLRSNVDYNSVRSPKHFGCSRLSLGILLLSRDKMIMEAIGAAPEQESDSTSTSGLGSSTGINEQQQEQQTVTQVTKDINGNIIQNNRHDSSTSSLQSDNRASNNLNQNLPPLLDPKMAQQLVRKYLRSAVKRSPEEDLNRKKLQKLYEQLEQLQKSLSESQTACDSESKEGQIAQINVQIQILLNQIRDLQSIVPWGLEPPTQTKGISGEQMANPRNVWGYEELGQRYFKEIPLEEQIFDLIQQEEEMGKENSQNSNNSKLGENLKKKDEKDTDGKGSKSLTAIQRQKKRRKDIIAAQPKIMKMRASKIKSTKNQNGQTVSVTQTQTQSQGNNEKFPLSIGAVKGSIALLKSEADVAKNVPRDELLSNWEAKCASLSMTMQSQNYSESQQLSDQNNFLPNRKQSSLSHSSDQTQNSQSQNQMNPNMPIRELQPILDDISSKHTELYIEMDRNTGLPLPFSDQGKMLVSSPNPYVDYHPAMSQFRGMSHINSRTSDRIYPATFEVGSSSNNEIKTGVLNFVLGLQELANLDTSLSEEIRVELIEKENKLYGQEGQGQTGSGDSDNLNSDKSKDQISSFNQMSNTSDSSIKQFANLNLNSINNQSSNVTVINLSGGAGSGPSSQTGSGSGGDTGYDNNDVMIGIWKPDLDDKSKSKPNIKEQTISSSSSQSDRNTIFSKNAQTLLQCLSEELESRQDIMDDLVIRVLCASLRMDGDLDNVIKDDFFGENEEMVQIYNAEGDMHVNNNAVTGGGNQTPKNNQQQYQQSQSDPSNTVAKNNVKLLRSINLLNKANTPTRELLRAKLASWSGGNVNSVQKTKNVGKTVPFLECASKLSSKIVDRIKRGALDVFRVSEITGYYDTNKPKGIAEDGKTFILSNGSKVCWYISSTFGFLPFYHLESGAKQPPLYDRDLAMSTVNPQLLAKARMETAIMKSQLAPPIQQKYGDLGSPFFSDDAHSGISTPINGSLKLGGVSTPVHNGGSGKFKNLSSSYIKDLPVSTATILESSPGSQTSTVVTTASGRKVPQINIAKNTMVVAPPPGLGEPEGEVEIAPTQIRSKNNDITTTVGHNLLAAATSKLVEINTMQISTSHSQTELNNIQEEGQSQYDPYYNNSPGPDSARTDLILDPEAAENDVRSGGITPQYPNYNHGPHGPLLNRLVYGPHGHAYNTNTYSSENEGAGGYAQYGAEAGYLSNEIVNNATNYGHSSNLSSSAQYNDINVYSNMNSQKNSYSNYGAAPAPGLSLSNSMPASPSASHRNMKNTTGLGVNNLSNKNQRSFLNVNTAISHPLSQSHTVANSIAQSLAASPINRSASPTANLPGSTVFNLSQLEPLDSVNNNLPGSGIINYNNLNSYVGSESSGLNPQSQNQIQQQLYGGQSQYQSNSLSQYIGSSDLMSMSNLPSSNQNQGQQLSSGGPMATAAVAASVPQVQGAVTRKRKVRIFGHRAGETHYNQIVQAVARDLQIYDAIMVGSGKGIQQGLVRKKDIVDYCNKVLRENINNMTNNNNVNNLNSNVGSGLSLTKQLIDINSQALVAYNSEISHPSYKEPVADPFLAQPSHGYDLSSAGENNWREQEKLLYKLMGDMNSFNRMLLLEHSCGSCMRIKLSIKKDQESFGYGKEINKMIYQSSPLAPLKNFKVGSDNINSVTEESNTNSKTAGSSKESKGKNQGQQNQESGQQQSTPRQTWQRKARNMEAGSSYSSGQQGKKGQGKHQQQNQNQQQYQHYQQGQQYENFGVQQQQSQESQSGFSQYGTTAAASYSNGQYNNTSDLVDSYYQNLGSATLSQQSTLQYYEAMNPITAAATVTATAAAATAATQPTVTEQYNNSTIKTQSQTQTQTDLEQIESYAAKKAAEAKKLAEEAEWLEYHANQLRLQKQTQEIESSGVPVTSAAVVPTTESDSRVAALQMASEVQREQFNKQYSNLSNSSYGSSQQQQATNLSKGKKGAASSYSTGKNQNNAQYSYQTQTQQYSGKGNNNYVGKQNYQYGTSVRSSAAQHESGHNFEDVQSDGGNIGALLSETPHFGRSSMDVIDLSISSDNPNNPDINSHNMNMNYNRREFHTVNAGGVSGIYGIGNMGNATPPISPSSSEGVGRVFESTNNE